MQVPPYVPQPIEIPGNVAQEGYGTRLGFIRRVVVLYFVSLAVVLGASFASIDIGPFDAPIVVASLLVLSLARALAKGRDMEQRISMALSPALYLSLGILLHRLAVDGWPVWALPIGPILAIAYTLSCGRDLSFLAMWFLASLVSSIAVVAIAIYLRNGVSYTIEAEVLSFAYLSYWVYDLAALLTRRRLGEEFGAVLDLYRDVLNMFSYPVRVAKHWRKHRIWSARS